MFEVHRKELMWGGRRLVLETGKVARQADGAVMATYGETTVLCTAVANKQAKPGQDFFPLTVNYQEKTFAAGKIPGGFFKREGRPSEKETLTSRLIDRPIRPLFAPGFRNETQVVCTVLSHDLENDPDIVALVGASAALTLSGIPFVGPIGGARVGYIDGRYVLNPKLEEMPNSQLDLIVAGTQIAAKVFKEIEKDIVRGAILKGEPRIDGRDTKTIRPIVCEVGVLPRAHGSAIFTRGETQAIVVTTLGTGQDEQIIDALEGEYRSHFMLHYNFPPYSTGEAGRMGSPGRREIGHCKLAWRAVHPLLPSKESFPYTVRVVSEITESNGSSSMASVCGASLSLM